MNDMVEENFNPKFLQWIHEFPSNIRPNWDSWFLLFAFQTSRRSSCLRKKCGAIIVKEKDIIATGYNGSPHYQCNCSDDILSCYRNEQNIPSGTQLERCRAAGSHAESNAIAYASRNGHSTLETIMYMYGHSFICNICKGIIANAGIKEVIHLQDDGIIHRYTPEKDWCNSPIDNASQIAQKVFKNRCKLGIPKNNEEYNK